MSDVLVPAAAADWLDRPGFWVAYATMCCCFFLAFWILELLFLSIGMALEVFKTDWWPMQLGLEWLEFFLKRLGHLEFLFGILKRDEPFPLFFRQANSPHYSSTTLSSFGHSSTAVSLSCRTYHYRYSR